MEVFLCGFNVKASFLSLIIPVYIKPLVGVGMCLCQNCLAEHNRVDP